MHQRRGIVQALFLALLLAVGAGLAWVIVVMWAYEVGSSRFRRAAVYETLQLRRDGTPIIRSQMQTAIYPVEFRYRTLDGEELDVKSTEQMLTPASLVGPLRMQQWSPSYAWFGRIATSSDYRQQPTYWYFVHDGRPHGNGYFVGYDSRSKLALGYISRQGFRLGKPPGDEQFSVHRTHVSAIFLQMYYYTPQHHEPVTSVGYSLDTPLGQLIPWRTLLVAQDGVWQVDLRERTARLVRPSTDVVSITTLQRPDLWNDDGSQRLEPLRQFVVARTADRLLVLDSDGRPVRSYTLPQELRDVDFSLYEPADGTAIVQTYELTSTEQILQLYWLDEMGDITRREQVALQRGTGAADPRLTSCVIALAAPSPLAIAGLLTTVMPAESMQFGRAPTYADAIARSLRENWPGLLLAIAIGTVSAWYCRRRQTDYVLPYTGAWMTFVFLFGLPGLLGYSFHRRWSCRKECPNCRHPAVRDRDACTACGTEFPKPALKGIEVFA